MQTASTPYRLTGWLSAAAKLLPILVILAIALEFRPPKPPEPPVLRIDPGVSGIEFYNAGCSEYGGKHGYSYRFAKKDARCIFGEVHIPPAADMTETFLHTLFYDANGQVVGEENLPLTKQRSATIVTAHTGWEEAGHWQPGIYRVELIIEDKLVAAGEFLITDP